MSMMNWFTPQFARQSSMDAPKPAPEQPFKPKLRYELFAVAEQRPMESSQCDRAITYNGVKVGVIEYHWSAHPVGRTGHYVKRATANVEDAEIDREIQHWFAQYVVAEAKAHKIHQDAFMAKCAEDREARRLAMRAAIGMDDK
jgi:hypothetical protein